MEGRTSWFGPDRHPGICKPGFYFKAVGGVSRLQREGETQQKLAGHVGKRGRQVLACSCQAASGDMGGLRVTLTLRRDQCQQPRQELSGS